MVVDIRDHRLKAERDIIKDEKSRLTAQRDIEGRLSEFTGLSIMERMGMTREGIFKQFGNVEGDEPTAIRTVDMDAGDWWSSFSDHFQYPSGEMVEEFYNGLLQLSDDLYHEFNEGNWGVEAKKRLTVVIYGIGIVVHPYSGGNGQSMRVVAETYLNEGEEEIKYLPYKEPWKAYPLTCLKTADVDGLPNSDVDWQSDPGSVALAEAYWKNYKNGDDIPDGLVEASKYPLQVYWAVFERSPRLELNGLLDYILNSNDGYEFCHDFVRDGKIRLSENRDIDCYRELMGKFFGDLVNDFDRISQTKVEHEKQYQKLMSV